MGLAIDGIQPTFVVPAAITKTIYVLVVETDTGLMVRLGRDRGSRPSVVVIFLEGDTE